jgi:glutamate synthase domain-containing protein 1/glutamate synthase domain-containing protein 3
MDDSVYKEGHLPVVKDGCGIFGMIRKKDAMRIASSVPVKGISSVSYRGGGLGAGYASFTLTRTAPEWEPFKLTAFVRDEAAATYIRKDVERKFGRILHSRLDSTAVSGGGGGMKLLTASVSPYDVGMADELDSVVDGINMKLFSGSRLEGRIVSFGRFVDVYKGVGYPMDVAKAYSLDSGRVAADMWIAHTRQPTNSPGTYPFWSHPFASMECAIVHNGDISSFGSNINMLRSWGFRSHAGTDSEVIARLLDRLVRVERLTIEQACTVLTGPFEEDAGDGIQSLMHKYRGARLDGPFSVAAGFSDGDDLYLIALVDRSKFRPMVIGEDDNHYYVASEESQIRLISPEARTWRPEPGSFFIASLSRGLIAGGCYRRTAVAGGTGVLLESREERQFQFESSDESDTWRTTVDASSMTYEDVNSFIKEAAGRGEERVRLVNVMGHRYIGMGLSAENNMTVELHGYPGNCLANLNEGLIFSVYGNVADDACDTMHRGGVIVYGDAGDVLGQALQGGFIFVRGSAGNRVGIQMREYHAETEKPTLIIGETCDDYLCEYMAGGTAIVLNLLDSPKPIGMFAASGMVGGRLYIRGVVGEEHFGLNPRKEDVLNYLRAAVEDGVIDRKLLREIEGAEILKRSLLRERLNGDLFSRIEELFYTGRHSKPLRVENRKLLAEDLEYIGSPLSEYFDCFGIQPETAREILNSEFTVVTPFHE